MLLSPALHPKMTTLGAKYRFYKGGIAVQVGAVRPQACICLLCGVVEVVCFCAKSENVNSGIKLQHEISPILCKEE
jgi:hypothetical protein